MVCISCKTSYNVPSRLGTGSNRAHRGVGGLGLGGGWSLIFGVGGEGGGVTQKKESPDFRFPEVGISAKVFLHSSFVHLPKSAHHLKFFIFLSETTPY